MQVALEFPNPVGGYGTKWVEVNDVDELKRFLQAESVISCGRYSRCIGTGDGRFDGESRSVDELTQDDLEWAATTESTRTRYINCVRQLTSK
ncbi:MAG: hypothetical protein H6822_08515 [Planctomycetaceae bacterium]|nr:hypothetical protein [Planctomycetales bacterium]MCB9922212.1 hypothetical protein [Planctomycetaceae bacterium]